MRVCPLTTDSQAYLSAATPDVQMPDVEMTSHGGMASSPCTMTPWFGINWSGSDVPVARHSMSFSAKWLPARPRTASAVSWALLIVASPVSGSMA